MGASHTLAESPALVVSSGSVCAIGLATAAGLAARRTVCVYSTCFSVKGREREKESQK